MHKKFILLSFITLPFELPTQIAAFVELYYVLQKQQNI